MYEYKFVEAKTEGWFRVSTYEEEIKKHARAGWRFVSAIVSNQRAEGYIVSYTLVFEKQK